MFITKYIETNVLSAACQIRQFTQMPCSKETQHILIHISCNQKQWQGLSLTQPMQLLLSKSDLLERKSKRKQSSLKRRSISMPLSISCVKKRKTMVGVYPMLIWIMPWMSFKRWGIAQCAIPWIVGFPSYTAILMNLATRLGSASFGKKLHIW